MAFIRPTDLPEYETVERDNSMFVKHMISETSYEIDVQGLGIIRLKLDCLNPNFLALKGEYYVDWLRRNRKKLRNIFTCYVSTSQILPGVQYSTLRK